MLSVRATFHGGWRPNFQLVTVSTPQGEARPVHVRGEVLVREGDAWTTFADLSATTCPLRFVCGPPPC